jgi:hypothetical protein
MPGRRDPKQHEIMLTMQKEAKELLQTSGIHPPQQAATGLARSGVYSQQRGAISTWTSSSAIISGGEEPQNIGRSTATGSRDNMFML